MMQPIVRIFKSLSVSFYLLIISTQALATTAAPTYYKLNNGLEVYLKAERRAPTAIISLIYKVGSADETNGKTGIAHLLEHMLFRGTKLHPANSYAQTITNSGGKFNAWTNNDQTVYYAHVPSKAITTVLKLEADRMRNINFSKQNFNIEKNVVLEEWRMRIGDNPHAKARSSFNAAAYLANPYHHPVIGWHSDLINLKDNYARQFYKKYYQPNNAALIIIGDFNIAKTKKIISKYFSKIKSKKIDFRIPNPKQLKHGIRTVRLYDNIHVPWLQIGFNCKNYAALKNKTKAYALLVLAAALQSGSGGLIPEEMLHNNYLISSANVYYNPFTRYNSLFKISVTAMPHIKTNIIKKNIWRILKQLKSKLLSSEQLARIKTEVKSEHIYLQDSIQEQASWAGMIIGNNYPRQIINNFAKQINKINAKDVRQAAQETFNKKFLTTATLLPNHNKPPRAKQ